jgi:cell division protein ZapA
METQSIRVKIYGAEYPLRGENPEYLMKIANYVDEMMLKMKSRIPDQPPLTIAILSALNITEDLLKERQSKDTVAHELERELKKVSEYLDKCLNY